MARIPDLLYQIFMHALAHMPHVTGERKRAQVHALMLSLWPVARATYNCACRGSHTPRHSLCMCKACRMQSACCLIRGVRTRLFQGGRSLDLIYARIGVLHRWIRPCGTCAQRRSPSAPSPASAQPRCGSRRMPSRPPPPGVARRRLPARPRSSGASRSSAARPSPCWPPPCRRCSTMCRCGGRTSGAASGHAPCTACTA